MKKARLQRGNKKKVRLKFNNGTEKKRIKYNPESYGRMVDSYLAILTCKGSATLKKILTILVDNPSLEMYQQGHFAAVRR